MKRIDDDRVEGATMCVNITSTMIIDQSHCYIIATRSDEWMNVQRHIDARMNAMSMNSMFDIVNAAALCIS